MTQKHRDEVKRKDRENLMGVGRGRHPLDETTGDDLGPDKETQSGGHEGIAGVHDVRKEIGYKRLLEELNWWIAHAEGAEPGLLSPMRQELEPAQVFRLAGLTREQEEVWALKAEGQKVATIAEYLGISPGLVQSRINWGRLKLKVWVSDALLDTG